MKRDFTSALCERESVRRARPRSSPAICILATFAVAMFVGGVFSVVAEASAADQPPAHVPNAENGRRLFERVWQVGTSPNNDRDGLGPVFNERSCVACHDRGGVGGGGLNSKNVELISVAVPKNLAPEFDARNPILTRVPGVSPELAALRRRAGMLHSDLFVSAGTMLHTFGTESRYVRFREQLLNLSSTKLAIANAAATKPASATGRNAEARRWPDDQPLRTIEHGDVTLLLTRRNSSAMFGSALIDAVAPAELERIAAEQAQADHGITGRVVGKFGWRGQTPDLKSFVRGACVAEIGLEVPGESPAANPLKSTADYQNNPAGWKPSTDRKTEDGSHDLSTAQVEDLLRFVSSLPAPAQRYPQELDQAAAVAQGKVKFQSVGCASCHRETVGPAIGVYSDLLAHDMGAALEDPQAGPKSLSTMSRVSVPSVPILVTTGPILTDAAKQRVAQARTYYPVQDYVIVPPNDTVEVDIADRTREWRTPPLWGVADSAPYLHDGRAPTLDTAILLHGGEAAKSVESYRTLTEEDRARLLAFLNSLAAPPPLPPLAPETKPEKTNAVAGKATL